MASYENSHRGIHCPHIQDSEGRRGEGGTGGEALLSSILSTIYEETEAGGTQGKLKGEVKHVLCADSLQLMHENETEATA